MHNKSVKELQDEWYEENAPFGKQLGYPECCIKAFCLQPPELLKKIIEPSEVDIMRYNAGCMKGEFTGFIPCEEHAKEIISGKRTLESLITDRDKTFPPFPITPPFM